MTMRVFVCHAKADIEATSEIVDLLEAALELPEGALSTSSLPGYSSDIRSEAELHQMLSEAAVVLALSSEHSLADTGVYFELGAAWALGIRIVPLLTGDTDSSALPWALRGIPPVQPHDQVAWLTLIEELAEQLGVRATRATSDPHLAFDAFADDAPLDAPSARPAASSHSSAVFPAVRVTSEENMRAPLSNGEAPDAFEAAVAADHSTMPSLPSCEMSLQAGRALSDCVFNRDADLNFARELDTSFGRFVDALGGNWNNLRKLQDLEVWLGVTDNLLAGLPTNQRKIADWYEIGYELSTLHNLAGHAADDPSQERSEVEALWREALERFLARAEALHIPYEEIASVLALLENLVSPPNQRDFSNISRSLDELRRHAGNADRLHSAA